MSSIKGHVVENEHVPNHSCWYCRDEGAVCANCDHPASRCACATHARETAACDLCGTPAPKVSAFLRDELVPAKVNLSRFKPSARNAFNER